MSVSPPKGLIIFTGFFKLKHKYEWVKGLNSSMCTLDKSSLTIVAK